MKKRLEAELISIAHRILKLKNKADVDQLHKESRKLYETLSVLKFYHDNFDVIKKDISQEVLEENLIRHIEKEEQPKVVVSTTPVASELVTETPIEIKEAKAEKKQTAKEVNEIPAVEDESFEDNDLAEDNDKEDHESDDVQLEEPIFELGHEEEEEANEEEEIEEVKTAEIVKSELKQVTFDSLLGENYSEPVFIKPEEVSLFSLSKIDENEYKSVTLNDALSKSIAVGLNDRIGFVKHLFGESNEDFNRVLSQLNTFDSLEEAKNFIDDMVKPDYNNWEGEGEFEERFMEIVSKKFL